jgi:hypothetical protein
VDHSPFRTVLEGGGVILAPNGTSSWSAFHESLELVA